MIKQAIRRQNGAPCQIVGQIAQVGIQHNIAKGMESRPMTVSLLAGGRQLARCVVRVSCFADSRVASRLEWRDSACGYVREVVRTESPSTF